jgi:uncharacterized RDD family membrane protein YckC
MAQLTELPYAGFWRRAAAWVTDAVVFLAAALMFTRVIGGLAGLFAVYGCYVVYSALCEASRYHATLGKYLFGLWVADLEGCAVSSYRAAGRTVAKQVSQAVFPFGHVIVSFTDQKQALHDLLASTLVLRRNRNG